MGAGWGASPPSSSCQALCEEEPQVERIEIWEGPGAIKPHTPSSHRRGGPTRPQEGKGLASSRRAQGGGPRWQTLFPLLLSRAAAVCEVFSRCLWACTGPGNSWGRMWLGFLRVAQRRGAPASLPQALTSASGPSSTTPSLCRRPHPC